jgi:surfeit locus 1 family protein
MSAVRRNFRPGIAVSLLAVAGLVLFISLGNWQMRRADEKLARQAVFDARQAVTLALPARPVSAEEYEWARISARGEFVAGKTVLLDNKVAHGRAGYQVVTPLRLEGGSLTLLVNRGWVAAGPRRDVLPDIRTPVGLQQVEGIAVVPTARFVELDKDAQAPEGRVWQNLTVARFAQWSGLALQPVVMQQTNETNDGLERAWEPPNLGADKHRSYALQWYSMAVLILVLYVFLNFRKQS